MIANDHISVFGTYLAEIEKARHKYLVEAASMAGIGLERLPKFDNLIPVYIGKSGDLPYSLAELFDDAAKNGVVFVEIHDYKMMGTVAYNWCGFDKEKGNWFSIFSGKNKDNIKVQFDPETSIMDWLNTEIATVSPLFAFFPSDYNGFEFINKLNMLRGNK